VGLIERGDGASVGTAEQGAGSSGPQSWAANIVSFKGYSTDEAEGRALWQAVHARVAAPDFAGVAEDQARYGEPALIRPRLGQGGFRILVTDTYRRRSPLPASGPCRLWTRPTSARSPTAAPMRRRTAFSFGATSTACSTPASHHHAGHGGSARLERGLPARTFRLAGMADGPQGRAGSPRSGRRRCSTQSGANNKSGRRAKR